MPRLGGLSGSEADVSKACGSVERERRASMAAEGALHRHEGVHEWDGAIMLARMSLLVATLFGLPSCGIACLLHAFLHNFID